jgi:phosphatidyl-myo-inositol dimannoside synthase
VASGHVHCPGTLQSPSRRALFCTITQEPGHGGIARVSSLLWQVMQTRSSGSSWKLLVAATGPKGALTFRDKLSFSKSAIWRQMLCSYDTLFFDHIGLARVQNLIPHSLRRPYGVFLHSIEAWTSLSRSHITTLANAKVRVANSHYTAKRVAAAHPEIGEIQVCHLALGLNMLAVGPEVFQLEHGIEDRVLGQIKPDAVVIVGRMMKNERYKGHDQLINSWSLVIKSVPDAQLVIVGEGDDVVRLRALAQCSNAAQNIVFTGRINDRVLEAIYRRAAVFAMPSRAEGFGIVYLEAMAHRLACIGSIHDAAGEIIVDGETGFLVQQDAIADLASKIVLLLKDADLRRRFGCNGYQRLQTRFSFECFETRISALLTQLSV